METSSFPAYTFASASILATMPRIIPDDEAQRFWFHIVNVNLPRHMPCHVWSKADTFQLPLSWGWQDLKDFVRQTTDRLGWTEVMISPSGQSSRIGSFRVKGRTDAERLYSKLNRPHQYRCW